MCLRPTNALGHVTLSRHCVTVYNTGVKSAPAENLDVKRIATVKRRLVVSTFAKLDIGREI